MAGKPSQKSLDDVAQLRNVMWLETESDVKNEATIVKEKLHAVREKYRKNVQKPPGVKESNRLMIEWNEDLLSFCKANRRKYQMEDRTLKLDRQRLEDQRIIAQHEEEIEKLRKDLQEETEAKEHALNRLSELQSHLLKAGNPDITDLGDQNRPTKLGENYRELYDNEWTDAFEVLTEGETSREDEEAIEMLYELLKRCNQLCSEALQEQQKSLAQLVSDPAYFKKKPGPTLSPSKPAVPLKKSGNATQGMAQSLNEKTPLTQQANLAKTMPAGSLRTGDKVTGPQAQQDEQGDTKETVSDATKSNTGKVEVPIKEFSKSVAPEVLKHVEVMDILPALNEEKKYKDVLQNVGIQKYIEKCIHLCWLMGAQYPPMVLDFETKSGIAFNTNVFETYTNRGPKIARVVWPPVYLHTDGPLVCKGYAEGRKE